MTRAPAQMKDGGKEDQSKQIAQLKAELATAKAKARDFGSSCTNVTY